MAALDVRGYWQAVLDQDRAAMARYFHSGAVIRWPNTNEQFTLEEFLRANCAYPGRWTGEVERVETAGELVIAVVRVRSLDRDQSLHAVSLIRVEGERIASIDEYWGDDGPVPAWRREMGLGRPILGL